MKAEIVKIGNSQGIRIPKVLLEQCNLNGLVELEVTEGKLIIKPVKKLREGWEESFRAMAEEQDDDFELWDAASPAPEDIDWEWEHE